MVSALIATLGLVVVTLITTASQLLTSRNDRALTHQEVDLLGKLDPQSKAATDLNEVIQARIGRWHAAAYKTQVNQSTGKSSQLPRHSELPPVLGLFGGVALSALAMSFGFLIAAMLGYV